MMKANGIPACHDVIGNDAAKRVRYYGHFSISLKVWIPGAEECVQAIQLQSQTPCDLKTNTSKQPTDGP